ncbi:sigma-54 interaction domain-containing protein [Desulfatibacillum aliphaticivorans]|uniref:sigma-54 interaction domain-containing protein n=1 Tax=Desulfatibacillum aliphaticivorans TaxID=218208 RepID=UPI0004249D3D|nr:sigma-54 dependent transcriptional regulator [Desulfatibacillum aliphaticivorans]
MLLKIALCIDNPGLLAKLKKSLESLDINLEAYGPGRFTWQKVIRSCADIVVINESLLPRPIETSIAALNDLPENPATIILHTHESSEDQAGLVAAGADAALHAGLPPRSIVQAIEGVMESRLQYIVRTAPPARPDDRPRLEDFRSNSQSMQAMLQEVRQVVGTNAQLLITGETGVGKERLARAIHFESPRASGPFVTVNMAALPEQLLESELFGHIQGAFTGAVRSRRGAFEMAHRGAIFLDEIGEMPIHLQAKLLRVLQDFEVKPLGGEKAMWVDVRVIAATNRDLEEDVRAKAFRGDLFYRLSVITITIPPLRERREDIAHLAKDFIAQQHTRHGKDVESISQEAMEALTRYDWPGNVRELFNVLERAIILCPDQEITLRDLPHIFKSNVRTEHTVQDAAPESWKGKTLREVTDQALSRVEKLYLESVLEESAGKIGPAADIAGITTRSLYNKMKKYDLDKRDFKQA